MKPKVQTEEQRIYVAVAATIQVPAAAGVKRPPLRTVVQPIGRQVAQVAHVVSKLRHQNLKIAIDIETRSAPVVWTDIKFEPITTIVLQARDSAEMAHVHYLLVRKRLTPVIFSDTNNEYGPGEWPTAIAVLATKKQIQGIMDYLPLWGTKEGI